MKIRPATMSDAGAIAALAGELGYPTDAEEMSARLAALSESRNDAIFVVVLGLAPVAWIHVALVTLLEAPLHAEIRGLIVTASLRSYGLGAQLVAVAEEWARSQGVTRIRVRSNVVRERTHAFYERLGYTTTKAQMVFDKQI